MAMHISPGVYVSIVPLETYVEGVETSTALSIFLADKGPDNEMIFIDSIKEFSELYGNPNYLKYGPEFGAGHLTAYKFIQISPSAYTMRVLPPDATYSDIGIINLLYPDTFVDISSLTDAQCQIVVNSQGSLTYNFNYGNDLPHSPTDLFNPLYLFATSQQGVYLGVNSNGRMYVVGTPNGNATVPLYTNGQVTGSIILTPNNEITLTGTGTSNWSTKTYDRLYTEDNILKTTITSFSNITTSFSNLNPQQLLENFISTYRPLYAQNNVIIDSSSSISPTEYAVSFRMPTHFDDYANIPKVVAVDNPADPQNYLVGSIVSEFTPNGYQYTFVPSYEVPVTQIAVGKAEDVLMLEKIINNQLYVLSFTNNNGSYSLFWGLGPNQVNLAQSNNFISDFVAFVQSKYRGQWYNNVQISLENYNNRIDVFKLNVYDTSSGMPILLESFNVSFNPNMVNSGGQTIYIDSTVKELSNNVIWYTLNNNPYSEYRQLIVETPSGNTYVPVNCVIPVVTNATKQITSSGWYYITPNCNTSGQWFTTLTNYLGQIVFIRSEQFGQLATVVYSLVPSQENIYFDGEEYYLPSQFTAYPVATAYFKDVTDNGIASKFQDGISLLNGSDGSLFNGTQLNTNVATQLLVQGFLGEIDRKVTNTEFYWIDLVLDGGYPKPVKDAIVTLTSEIRLDCIALIDNGYNLSADQALTSRLTMYNFDTEYAAIYEPYIQIYDEFSGRYLWVTPIYAVAELFALLERNYDIWYAVAGFDRGTSPSIIKLTYNAHLADRDNFYINQINPFVSFREGIVLWGNLTTRRETDALQNINVMRLVLYIKRMVSVYCKQFIFDLMTPTLVKDVKNGITQFLSGLQAQEALYSFSVDIIMTTEDIIEKTMYVNITIFPVRALERIDITIFVQ